MESKTLFAELYQALLGKERGPRLGKLIAALGVARVKKDLGI
jgi:lysyl-tRNA synthetase class I